MMQHNPEIETIIINATDIAKKFNHEYVTLEHLTHGMFSYQPFAAFAETFGVDVATMLTEITDYLSQQTSIVSNDPDYVPKKTHSLERVFNRAFSQVLFSNRTHVQIIDIFSALATKQTAIPVISLSNTAWNVHSLWNITTITM